jgi:hypothetical protein
MRSGRRSASLTVCRYDLVEHATEFLQAGSGDDNGIPAAIGILRYAQETAPGIFSQVKNKIFALYGDVFTFQDGIHL